MTGWVPARRRWLKRKWGEAGNKKPSPIAIPFLSISEALFSPYLSSSLFESIAPLPLEEKINRTTTSSKKITNKKLPQQNSPSPQPTKRDTKPIQKP